MPDTSPDYTLWAAIASAASAVAAWFAKDLIPRLLGREEKLTLAEIEAQTRGTPSGDNLLGAFKDLNDQLREEWKEEKLYLRAQVDAYRMRAAEYEREIDKLRAEVESLRARIVELEGCPDEIRFLRQLIGDLGGDPVIPFVRKDA